MSSRQRSRAWKFTVVNADESMVAQFIDKLLDAGITDYVFQLECGKENQMKHFQGVCRFSNPRDSWPFNEFNGLHCKMDRCNRWRQYIKYCVKVDTRVAGPWSNIRDLKFRKTIVDPLYGKELYDWQKEIMDIVKGPVHDRKIYWFWDQTGNKGKSSLAKHLCMFYRCCLCGGGAKDNFFAINKFLENTDLDIVIFDIPRCSFNSISYKTIEGVKNGLIFSSKYESGQIMFNSPHVIVFANFPPNCGKLSIDRWVIKEII